MKKKELKFKIFFSVIFLCLFTSIYFYVSYTEEIDLGDRIITIIIKPGDNLSTVSQQLLNKGVIRSKIMLKYPARLKGIDKQLTPGRYDFTGKNSCQSVLDKLAHADFLKIKITIPEGSTIWETASLLAETLELDSAIIHNFNSDQAFLDKHHLQSLEGYLFPETYYIRWGTDEEEVVEILLAMFKDQTKDVWDDNRPNNLSDYEVLIMASIIEAETGLIDERDLVSSVYHNRLRNNMKLDADPTVIYGLGGLDRPLWKKDLRKDTPYNTYLRKSLPPTPINSPGLASIKAAMDPEDSDYLFFVADEKGGHIFSRTNAEHNRAIRKIRSGN